MLLLCGCKKIKNIEYKEVKVKIVDVHHNDAWIQTVRHIGIPTLITHDEKYEIIVEYNGDYYAFTDKKIYERYSGIGAIGKSATGVLAIITYSDGLVENDIVSIK